jgi:hypothetical protein
VWYLGCVLSVSVCSGAGGRMCVVSAACWARRLIGYVWYLRHVWAGCRRGRWAECVWYPQICGVSGVRGVI